MSTPPYPAIAVVGPTASGKTALGMALARRSGGEIVACDALQVYRHMDIGTAKPAQAEREGIPHHMLDLRDPGVDFSAGDYLREGRATLRAIQAHGAVPIVVGGAGFYLRALIEGLFEGPGRSEALRSRLRAVVARRGPESIHRLLCRADPETAARLAPADADRNIRAYEICLLTGRPMSWWQSRPRDPLQGFRWLKLGIMWPRDALYARINERVEEMVRRGFVEEVRTLLQTYPGDCHAFKAIGYRQIAECVRGTCSLEDAVAAIQRESRRYAKRQMTWFRSDPEIVWLDGAADPDLMAKQAALQISSFLQSSPGGTVPDERL